MTYSFFLVYRSQFYVRNTDVTIKVIVSKSDDGSKYNIFILGGGES